MYSEDYSHGWKSEVGLYIRLYLVEGNTYGNNVLTQEGIGVS